MNISTIEQGEELLKAATQGKLAWYGPKVEIINGHRHYVELEIRETDAKLFMWLQNHASELLQMAREVEGLRERWNDHLKKEIVHRMTHSRRRR